MHYVTCQVEVKNRQVIDINSPKTPGFFDFHTTTGLNSFSPHALTKKAIVSRNLLFFPPFHMYFTLLCKAFFRQGLPKAACFIHIENIFSSYPGFSLKRGSVAPRHAILAGNTPTFLPRLAHAQILRRTLPRGEMASGLIGRKRRLS